MLWLNRKPFPFSFRKLFLSTFFLSLFLSFFSLSNFFFSPNLEDGLVLVQNPQLLSGHLGREARRTQLALVQRVQVALPVLQQTLERLGHLPAAQRSLKQVRHFLRVDAETKIAADLFLHQLDQLLGFAAVLGLGFKVVAGAEQQAEKGGKSNCELLFLGGFFPFCCLKFLSSLAFKHTERCAGLALDRKT